MAWYEIIMQHFLMVYHGIYPTCHMYILDIHTRLKRACVYICKHSDVGVISYGIPLKSIAYRIDMEYIFQC